MSEPQVKLTRLESTRENAQKVADLLVEAFAEGVSFSQIRCSPRGLMLALGDRAPFLDPVISAFLGELSLATLTSRC